MSPTRPRGGGAGHAARGPGPGRDFSRAQAPKFPCVRCGTPIRREPGDPPQLRCPVCRYRIYDYPRPCAGMIVMKGPDTLVLRRADAPKRGFLDTPGGFVNAGESLEAAARRELFEETAVRAGRAEWLGFYWDRYYLKGFGFFPTMNFYYLAPWRSGVPRAADDAASVEWVPLARLGRTGGRFAWKHMTLVLRDVKRRLAGVPAATPDPVARNPRGPGRGAPRNARRAAPRA